MVIIFEKQSEKCKYLNEELTMIWQKVLIEDMIMCEFRL